MNEINNKSDIYRIILNFLFGIDRIIKDRI